jgi:hypothetical protein
MSTVDNKSRLELELHLKARAEQEYKPLTSSAFLLALQSVPEATEEKGINSESGSSKRTTLKIGSSK